MSFRRFLYGSLVGVAGITPLLWAQGTNSGTPDRGRTTANAASDVDKVERVLAARRDYQVALEQLRLHYMSAGDLERARWAEEELRQFHRINKQAYRLELDVPPPTLTASKNFPEANELYRRAMVYKDKGWTGTDYLDNQRRAELLFQQILTNYPESDKIDDAAFQLGDIYESRAYKQYRRAAWYFGNHQAESHRPGGFSFLEAAGQYASGSRAARLQCAKHLWQFAFKFSSNGVR